jgi:orotidine-5'-phosphate decarboxylase
LKTFREKLQQAWDRSGSLLCVGLDPEPSRLPTDDVLRFNREIIDATADLVCAYKPNVAFYEAMGPEKGYGILRETLAAMPTHVIKLIDAKRGDVEHTARAYVRAFFDELDVDAVTVNPYLGSDSVAPWLERPDRAAFVLCRTSNPGAPDLQDLLVTIGDDSRPLFEIVAERAHSWDEHGNAGLVVGATFPAEMRRIRSLCPNMPFLVPGVGAQAGSLADAVGAGVDDRGRGMIINAARSVMYASGGSGFAAAARREAQRLRDEINMHREALAARP